MNWLAHLHLSGSDSAVQVGNMLPDLLSYAELAAVPDCYRAGIEQHRRIDAFTDAHPAFRRSRGRLPAELRRYGGIIMDVFYDHLLSQAWERFSAVPREAYIQGFYQGLDAHLDQVPASAAELLCRLREEDWLGSYHEMDGIAAALRRIGLRLRRQVGLHDCLPTLERDYPHFVEDFLEFFPALQAHVKA